MRKKNAKELFCCYRPVLFSFLVPFVIIGGILLFLLLKNGVAVIGGDCSAQMIPFMAEFRRKILSGESLFYSWSGGGGYDFWAVYCYYLSSPFTWLSLLVKEESLPLFVNFLVLLKLSLCGAGFSFYAVRKKICKNDFQVVLFSTLYAMCGYTAAYSIDIMWLEAVALFPLLILGMEYIVYDKKPALYTLTLALIFMCNYYLGFTVAIGVFFCYFTFRFENFRDFFMKSIRILGFSLLSAACCAVFLFPSYMVASEAGRDSANARFGFLDGFFDSIRNLLFYDTADTASNSASAANIYVTVFALYFVFLWFFAYKEKLHEKIKSGIIIAFLILSFNIGTLNMLWHGFRMPIMVQNRFSFMLCFILLVLAAKAFAEREKLEHNKAIGGSIAFVVFVAALAIADSQNKIRLSVSLLAAVAYVVLFFKLKKSKLQFAVFSICAVIGVATGFFLCVENGTGRYREDVYDTAVAEAVDEIQTEDFYREKNLCYDKQDIMPNAQILYGLRGFPIFSSYINAKQTVQYIRFGLVNYIWDSYWVQVFEGNDIGNFNNPNSFNIVADSLSGSRYIYAYSDTKLPVDLLQKVYEKNNVTVYKNEYALPIVFQLQTEVVEQMNNTARLPYSIYTKIAKSLDEALYNSCVMTLDMAENTDCSKTPYGTYTIFAGSDSSPQATFSYRVKADDTDLTLYYGAQEKIDVSVFCNGEEIYNNEQYFSDFPDLGSFNEGDLIEIEVSANKAISFSIELMTFNADGFVSMQKKLNETALVVTDSKSDYIAGTVVAKSDHSLFTTIPYSKYWTAIVDGQETEISSLNKGFIILPLTEGTHTIELRYTPPMFWECLLISIFGIILSFAVFFIYDKKQRRGKEDNIEQC